jgi:hypothetical protein
MAKKNKNGKDKARDKDQQREVQGSATASVARVTEIIASSPQSFDDAIQAGVARACKTLQNVKGAWIKDQTVKIENNQIAEYRVVMLITFVLND